MNKNVITTERIPIKLWLDDIEDGALAQAKNLANLPFAYKHIAIMPDAHQGYGMCIGGVMATEGIVSPNCVGVDIGCGMCAIKSDINITKKYKGVTLIADSIIKGWLSDIREQIPVGLGKHNKTAQESGIFKFAPDIPIIQKELTSARKQLGSLGSGNHFIEIQKDEDGFIWVMIHSGSRNLGYKTAEYYHDAAKGWCKLWYSNIPNSDLSFLPLDLDLGQAYIEAMNFCLKFARASRNNMMGKILKIIGEKRFPDMHIDVHHNYATMENHFGKNVMVHRKGATLARKGTIGIIPGSMGTNSYIVEGLGNPESFNSCSHGAGRRMGRSQATRELDLEVEQAKMEGIIGGPRTTKELDELFV